MANRLLSMLLGIAVMSTGMAYAGDQASPTSTQISSKQNDGKAVAALPDVCETPPSRPDTPHGVPIPYPNTGMASDTTEGSKKVKISGEEVMLKNRSYFKKSSGDEPGAQYLSDIERSPGTPKSTEKVKIKGRGVGSKNKDYISDE